jgi:DNA-binding PucR family transcriptional regulator
MEKTHAISSTRCTIERRIVLTVQDIVAMPALDLGVSAGAGGLRNEIRWLHASELKDPTPWLGGGELLLTTGIGIGESASAQRAYLRRLAKHGLAGLGFGLGFGYGEVPPALVAAADRLDFPIVSVPYEVPFIAISKAVFTHLASEQLELVTQALEVHERLAQAVLNGRGLQALLEVLCNHLGCSLALVDESGRILAERHGGRRLSFERALELSVVADDEIATLKAVRKDGGFGEYDRLVLHHGQTALAFELSRRHAVSAAELRLAGDLLEDLEHERLDERETARRMAAFGLEPARDYAAVLAVPSDGLAGEHLRLTVARELDKRAVPYLSTALREKASFLVEAASEEAVLALARTIVEAEPDARVGIGRPAHGGALGRSLLEARAALDAAHGSVASYRDLGSLELLLNLPDAALEAFVDRVLGQAAHNGWLVESLTALLESGCRWSEAAERLGVHRHTLRYRMERLREQTGRHPDEPEQRMELWLAVKASQALAARSEAET